MTSTDIIIHDEIVSVTVKDLHAPGETVDRTFGPQKNSLIRVRVVVRSKTDFTLNETAFVFADVETFRSFANQIVDEMGALLGDSVHWGPDRDDDLLAEDPHDERKLPYKVCTKCGYASETDAKYCRACSRLLP